MTSSKPGFEMRNLVLGHGGGESEGHEPGPVFGEHGALDRSGMLGKLSFSQVSWKTRNSCAWKGLMEEAIKERIEGVPVHT